MTMESYERRCLREEAERDAAYDATTEFCTTTGCLWPATDTTTMLCVRHSGDVAAA